MELVNWVRLLLGGKTGNAQHGGKTGSMHRSDTGVGE
jgi:hypothetical protein